MSFIRPGDYWILAVTIICILLITSRKLVLPSLILLTVTSGIILHGYGLPRLILHVIVVVVLIGIARKVLIKAATKDIIHE